MSANAKSVSDFRLPDAKLAVIKKWYGCSCFSNDEQECNLMIARAGFFLLRFLRDMPPRPGCQSGDHCSVSFKEISHTPHCHASRCSEPFPRALEVQEDIMKLENQIPIFAINMILKWEADTSRRLEEENGQGVTRQWKSCIDQDLGSILRRACHTLSPFPHMSDGHCSHKSVGVEESSHLLEFVYKNIILSNHSTYRAKRNQIWKKSPKFSTLPRATELQKKGVKFVAHAGLLNEIRFKGRTFYLPTIEMTERTDVFMRNLVAFEALDLKRKTEPVRCYVELMDLLINDAADVEVLLNAGIICSHLGTVEEVASVWNGMQKGLGSKGVYEPIDTAINGAIGFYHNSKYITMWVEFKETYFEKPWYLVAFIGGCISLFLSLWQIILAREQVQLQRESMKMG